jgi:hypothetical protein
MHRLLAIKEYEKRKGHADKGAPVGAQPIEICNVMKFFHVDLYAAAAMLYAICHIDRCSSTIQHHMEHFVKMDLDGDGKLSRAEFLEAFRRRAAGPAHPHSLCLTLQLIPR